MEENSNVEYVENISSVPSNNPPEKLSAVDELKNKINKYKRKLALIEKKDREKKRKERTHRLLVKGGTVEMVVGEESSIALLAGLLNEHKELFNDLNSGKSTQLIAIGNKLLAESKNK